VFDQSQLPAPTNIGRAVRKRLDFAGNSNPPSQPAREGSRYVDYMQSRDTDHPLDDDSETAAEDMAVELVAARSIWTERVERLLGVLDAMMPTAGKHGVAALVDGVRRELSSVEVAAQSTEYRGAQSGETAAIAFERERRMQLNWGLQLRSQLDTIREIQAGLLLAANRDNETSAADRGENIREAELTVVDDGSAGSGGFAADANFNGDTLVQVHSGRRLSRSLIEATADAGASSSDASLMRRVEDELEEFYTDGSTSHDSRSGGGNVDVSQSGSEIGDLAATAATRDHPKMKDVMSELGTIREEIDKINDSTRTLER
jgi:hypothetical protein